MPYYISIQTYCPQCLHVSNHIFKCNMKDNKQPMSKDSVLFVVDIVLLILVDFLSLLRVLIRTIDTTNVLIVITALFLAVDFVIVRHSLPTQVS